MKERLLNKLRNKSLSIKEFREYSHDLAETVAKEFFEKTPHNSNIILLPILRSGLAMLPSFISYFPNSKIGILGIRRHETTYLPQKYYENIPSLSPTHTILLLDPMLATGGSALLACHRLIELGANPNHIHLISFLASPQGLAKLNHEFPHLLLSVVTIDEGLDDHKLIVPGLGDFGDRYFGTEG